jgi:teichuronic acid biosynthesis glycosyltransferase TuaG
MKPDPLVSVICTARDASRTIEAMLRSILEQTLQRWELIVVDDGSTDDTIDIAAAYARQDRRVTVIQTPGVGRGRALNLALSCARAELIANIDADDTSHPRRLEFQSAVMARRRDISILCTDGIIVRDDEQAVWPCLDPEAIWPRLVEVTPALVLHNPVMHSSVMFRRANILAASGYAEDIPSQFDYELWVRMAARGHRIYRLELPLAANRTHDNQSFETRRRFAYQFNSARVQREAIRACRAPRHYIAIVWIRFMFGLLPRALRRGLKGTATAIWRTIRGSSGTETSSAVAAGSPQRKAAVDSKP